MAGVMGRMTVVDMVADWLEENGYDGLTDGGCSCCSGDGLMHCGIVQCRLCSAAYATRCTTCAHLTTCDRTAGADVFRTESDWCGDYEEA